MPIKALFGASALTAAIDLFFFYKTGYHLNPTDAGIATFVLSLAAVYLGAWLFRKTLKS